MTAIKLSWLQLVEQLRRLGIAQITGAAVPGESELAITDHSVNPDAVKKSPIETLSHSQCRAAVSSIRRALIKKPCRGDIARPPTERSGDMTDLTTTQMAGGLLDEFVRQYRVELEQLA